MFKYSNCNKLGSMDNLLVDGYACLLITFPQFSNTYSYNFITNIFFIQNHYNAYNQNQALALKKKNGKFLFCLTSVTLLVLYLLIDTVTFVLWILKQMPVTKVEHK